MKKIGIDELFATESKRSSTVNSWTNKNENSENINRFEKRSKQVYEKNPANNGYKYSDAHLLKKTRHSLKRGTLRCYNCKELGHRSSECTQSLMKLISLQDEKSTHSDTLEFDAGNASSWKGRDSYHGSSTYGNKNADFLNTIFNDDTPSPRGLTRDREAINQKYRRHQMRTGINEKLKSENQIKVQTKRYTDVQAEKPVESQLLPETFKIEVRRTVVHEGGIHYDETCIIKFPKNLPSNVQVITAQLVPGILTKI